MARTKLSLNQYEMLMSQAANKLRKAQDECNRLRVANAALVEALAESVRLQSHYAALLNQYDGGNRKGFCGAQEWIDRLAALAKVGQP